jgi:hypothetical protein
MEQSAATRRTEADTQHLRAKCAGYPEGRIAFSHFDLFCRQRFPIGRGDDFDEDFSTESLGNCSVRNHCGFFGVRG